MSTATRLGGFTLAAVVAFAGTYGIGRLVGPTDAPAPAAMGGHEDMVPNAPTGDQVGGLQVAEAGYTLQLLSGPGTAGRPTDLAFRILGPDRAPVTVFRMRHDKLMHLIVVRRDLTGFQHVHPVMSAGGTWHISLTLPDAGTYRAFADFAPDTHAALTLGIDLPVAGDYRPAPLPAPSRTTIVDDYTVTLDGDLAAGRTSPLVLSVSRSGRPVTDLEPYLAAYGHLVVLRAGDLGYVHIHPVGTPGDGTTPAGPRITFDAEVPTAGGYRLFLDFQHAGRVHTAAFTEEVA
jgi:hypothetical protein